MPDSIISHVSVGVADLPRARRFYDPVMGALGYGVVMEEPQSGAACGTRFPEFWISLPFDRSTEAGTLRRRLPMIRALCAQTGFPVRNVLYVSQSSPRVSPVEQTGGDCGVGGQVWLT